jgi:exonuclease I
MSKAKEKEARRWQKHRRKTFTHQSAESEKKAKVDELIDEPSFASYLVLVR